MDGLIIALLVVGGLFAMISAGVVVSTRRRHIHRVRAVDNICASTLLPDGAYWDGRSPITLMPGQTVHVLVPLGLSPDETSNKKAV